MAATVLLGAELTQRGWSDGDSELSARWGSGQSWGQPEGGECGGDSGDSSAIGPRLRRQWGHICAAERGDNHQRCGCGGGGGRMLG